MKKYSFHLALAGVLALTACSTEDIDTTGFEGIPLTFVASGGEEGATRTALDQNGTSVNWVANDAISLFDATGMNNVFTLTEGAGTREGMFDGVVTSPEQEWTALYPYTKDAQIVGNKITGLIMPANQVAVADGFDATTNFMTAHSTTNMLSFRQAVCYVKITLAAPSKKVIFRTNGTERLAGPIELTVGTDGVASNSVASQGEVQVSLVPANGESFIPAGSYRLGLMPQSLAQGFTVDCYNQDGSVKYVKSLNAATEIFARGKIINLGTTEGWSTVTGAHVCDNEYEFGKGRGVAEEVDLGLPSGLKWANMNVGALNPWEFGDYYAWAADEPWLQSYDLENGVPHITQWGNDNCKWHPEHPQYNQRNAPYNVSGYENAGAGKFWTKYTNNNPQYTADDNLGAEAISLTLLEPEDDAANVQWGDGWRMPTHEEQQELKDNTYWVWTTDYLNTGISGYIVYKVKDDSHKGFASFQWNGAAYASEYDVNTDTHIFLPSGGHLWGSGNDGGFGRYWSMSLALDDPQKAHTMYFASSFANLNGIDNRATGCMIRPVRQ